MNYLFEAIGSELLDKYYVKQNDTMLNSNDQNS